MTTETLEQANQDLRAAVQARLVSAGEHEPQIPADWILQGEAELQARRQAAAAGWKDVVAAAEPARQAVRIAQATTDERSDVYSEWQPPTGQTLRPGSAEFLAVLDELRRLHLRKCMDYGVDEDAFSNISSSADVVNVPAWAGCMIRIADKLHRIRSYFRHGRTEFDGVEDTLLDMASYAVIALIKYRQSRKP